MTGGIETALVDWEANAPRSIFFGDIYFSGDGAAESRHVFIDGNDLARRFETAPRLAIGELGFGTGLNILVAADLWRRSRKPHGARLEFLSFENRPLSPEDLARAHLAWPQFAEMSAALRAQHPPPVAGLHRIALANDITLTLVFGDARAMLPRVEARINAWFLDGFAPSKNPDMWSPEVFAGVASLSAPSATAATFTVAGDVRRALQAAGFAVEKRVGFGQKREMLAARIDSPPTASTRAPWFAAENMKALGGGARIAIIGGGVAGASLAFELAAAGIAPTIIDPNGVAAGASGNPAGLIMPRLDLGDGPAARFFRGAYLRAIQVIASLERASGERILNPCGVLLKAASAEEAERQRKIVSAGLLPAAMVEPRADGLFFPFAGVISPPRYCALLAKNASLIDRRAVAIARDAAGITIRFDDGARADFDAAIIANGRDALRFIEARTLPLKGVLGQIDCFPDAMAPTEAIVFGPYAAPAPSGGLVIGATYEKLQANAAPETSVAATAHNIAAMARTIPDIGRTLQVAASTPRASVRCQTPDRLPIAGPAPDWNHYGAAYDDLRLGKVRTYPNARAQENVFILTGLGARGLVTAPLAAAHVVSEMTGTMSSIERDVAEALHPARFFIRDLRRNRTIALKSGTEQENHAAGNEADERR